MAKQASRRSERRRALEILYEADLKDRPLPAVLASHLAGEDPPGDFATAIVRGVSEYLREADRLIEEHARDWKLDRMPIIDRNLMRMAIVEILHFDDVPRPVAIDEAVELAKELSTDDSGRFINGVLAHIHPPSPLT